MPEQFMHGVHRVAHAATIVIAVSLSISKLSAQEPPTAPQHAMADDDPMMLSMGDMTAAAGHLKLTPHWPERPGDQARADSLLSTARAALGKYTDVAAAERDGYHMFAPKLKQQRIDHYSNRRNARKARRSFDPTAPSALLYHPEADGTLRLVGAMYTAPADLPLEELDQRIPLSIAQWHQHTSICLPSGMVTGDMGDMGLASRDRRFGPRGSITTVEECQAAGGEFKQRMFSWMVHVNLFESDDLVWEKK